MCTIFKKIALTATVEDKVTITQNEVIWFQPQQQDDCHRTVKKIIENCQTTDRRFKHSVCLSSAQLY